MFKDISTHLTYVLSGILWIGSIASAGPWVDVMCSYEAGKNPNTGYTDPNAIFQAAEKYDDAEGIVSLGMWSKSASRGEPVGMILGFSTSVANLPGNDLLIVGNAQPGWYEPGYVEVAMETTAGQTGATVDGWKDETFFLLKPSNYDIVGDPRYDGPLTITWDQSADDMGENPYTDPAWSDPSVLTGYADVTPDGDEMDISWAIDVDESTGRYEYVFLGNIAYIHIRTVTDNPAGVFGYFTTELDYVEYLHVPEPATMVLLAAGGLLLRKKNTYT